MNHANHHLHQRNHSSEDDHSVHDGHSSEMFRKKFWLSAVLSVPIVFLSHTVAGFFGYALPDFWLINALMPVLGTILFFYGGMVFIKSARHEIKMKQPGMMTLISLAIIVAFLYSWAVSLGLDGMDFWWELATLITIMLLGHWLEMRSIAQAQGALGELARLLPDTANLLVDGAARTVKSSELKVGDLVLVQPGSRIPADGVVVGGESSVNESLLTGESQLQNKIIGNIVVGGSINEDGSLEVEVSANSGMGVLGGIMDAVKQAGLSQSKTQILADKFAGWLFYIALIVAFLTLIYWLVVGGHSPSFIIERVVTVLIVACPHALGLAIPLVVSIASSRAAKSGLLVRSREGLESLRNIDVVVFDKTGTLTKGEQSVVAIVGEDEKEVLKLALSIEKKSEHSIARAIINYADDKKLKKSYEINDFRAIRGKGAIASIDGDRILVGNIALMNEHGLKSDLSMLDEHQNCTKVYVSRGSQVVGAILLGDKIREESYQAIKSLKAMNIKPVILTGDSKGVTEAVAKELGVMEYYYDVLPEDKLDVIRQSQKSGKKVAMVGDGVNDAPALTQADIGIAIGAGTDVAIESADIVLSTSNPLAVIEAIRLSRATYRKMIQNLIWGAGYNIVALPLAAGIIAGITISPAVGAILMSASTIIVAINAQLLRISR